jgi:hypothetical protein
MARMARSLPLEVRPRLIALAGKLTTAPMLLVRNQRNSAPGWMPTIEKRPRPILRTFLLRPASKASFDAEIPSAAPSLFRRDWRQ